MLNKELLNRLAKVLPQLDRIDYIEKYFLKLKNEYEIQGFNIIGESKLNNTVMIDLLCKEETYRIYLKSSNMIVINSSDDSDYLELNNN